jgi:hypothetical protein
MNPSDFVLLCAGASGEETKRLCKLLNEWSTGDENGFPAQLALLTRSQWRVAATIPGAVNEARKLFERELAEQRQQIAALVKTYEQAAAAKIGELRRVIDEHASNSAKNVVELRGQLIESEKIAQRIRRDLESGAGKWNDATVDFEHANKRLTQLCADLQARPWRSHWVLMILLVIATFVAGYAIGLYRPL